MGNVPQILYGEEVSLAVEEYTSRGNAARGIITGGRAGYAKYMNILMQCVWVSDHNYIEQQYVSLIPLSRISILVLERHWSIFVKIIKS
jgi:hypothetical protein